MYCPVNMEDNVNKEILFLIETVLYVWFKAVLIHTSVLGGICMAELGISRED